MGAASASLGKKLAFGLIPAAIVWLGAEGAVSALFAAELSAWDDPPPAEAGSTPTMPGNPYLLYEYRPGRHLQAGVPVTINSLGLRGEEPVLPRPEGVRRFLTTGDSSIFGFGVRDEEVFSEVAEVALGPGVEAINGAIPGYSSYQSLNLLRLRALQTDPDLLVIGNLWSDNNFDAFVDKELLAGYQDYAQSGAGRVRGLLSVSPIFRVLDSRLRVRPAAEKIRWMQSGDKNEILDSGKHIGLRRVAIDDYAQNLEALVALARDHGAEVAFLLPANNEDLDVSADGGARQGKAWDPYRQVMKDAAARHGAPLLDVPALFLASGLGRAELFVDEMHPTAAGHAIMGKALADLLAAHDWPAGGTLMGPGTGSPLPDYTDPFVEGSAASPAGGPPPSPAGAPPPPGGQGAPSGAPPAPPPSAGPTIRGTLTYDRYESGTIQIETFSAAEINGNPQVLGTFRLEGPGVFTLEVRDVPAVALRAYIDLDGDGPDPEDQRFDLSGTVIDVSDPRAADLRVDLDAQTVHLGS